jgi:hypothetical protein
MSLTLAPTKRYFGLGDKNECIVREGRRVVGRIMFSQHAPPGHPWFWTITAPRSNRNGRSRLCGADARTGDEGF